VVARREEATVHGLGLFSLETRSYETRRQEGRLDWLAPRWLGDSRRLLVRGPRGISIVDTATWREKPLVEVGGYFIGQTLRVSRDERFLTWTETATEGDIWMVSLRQGRGATGGGEGSRGRAEARPGAACQGRGGRH
jgi:hypothetical protein